MRTTSGRRKSQTEPRRSPGQDLIDLSVPTVQSPTIRSVSANHQRPARGGRAAGRVGRGHSALDPVPAQLARHTQGRTAPGEPGPRALQPTVGVRARARGPAALGAAEPLTGPLHARGHAVHRRLCGTCGADLPLSAGPRCIVGDELGVSAHQQFAGTAGRAGSVLDVALAGPLAAGKVLEIVATDSLERTRPRGPAQRKPRSRNSPLRGLYEGVSSWAQPYH